ncbi:glycine betaine ABC transporter substrate-binding protein [Pseudobacteroides cellulosolvens]|uniref:ABC-type glycine betaine transport, periplasmic subunit n=1 Tax=Pseudobacteroides cellulosolvens ATCC 35603 = DSM 2933 TaxID=398512 RepID=A0A0L6JYM4_9FIRM|nr:glycine betaine ABC transporter substrate-binding protein [Pseudobacteroides cellulosolvens]KNY30615.1 ABC-type glycine betaine transport, periplasmic subunit [Pseudobacteroides cellulosolvens ATCC 35603 = DSM 2933]
MKKSVQTLGCLCRLSKGDIDIFMDSWLPDMHKNYMNTFGRTIDDVSVSYPNGELGWVVPTYVEVLIQWRILREKKAFLTKRYMVLKKGPA